MNLENQINDNIHPQPSFQIEADMQNRTIHLRVLKGEDTPYRYKGKAYRRNGTSSVEVDDYELNQLILQGRNLEFCDLPAPIQDLIFYRFDVFSKRRFSLPVRQDLLATLGCCNNAEGYTVIAELISDQNPLPGISVVQFGQSISQILNRKRFENESILELNEGVLNMAVDLLTYEVIDGIYRELKTKVPASALRVTILNAVIHRDWSLPQPVQIELFSDKMTVFLRVDCRIQ